ncbi:MAG: IS4 family transposase [Phycisphaerae bacterium]
MVKAMQRLGVEGFQRFWAALRREVPKRLRGLWTWYGWTVMAVDGSRVEAPRTRGNQRGLGRAGRQKTGPQWWVTWLIQLPSGLIWDWRQGPGTSSERTHLREMLPDLPANTLLVADAGFGGFDLWWELLQAGVDLLIRCVSNTALLSDASWSQIERQGQHRMVYLWPQNRRSQLPLRLRLIVLKEHGKRVYLLTNVLESQRLSRALAGELYAARWGVETDYRGLKQTLDRRRVLAETPAVGALELAGNILALALLLLQAAVAQGVRVVRVSVAAALRTVRQALECTRWGQSSNWFLPALHAALRDHYHRRRSKRARDWPHKKKESPPSPPNLRTLTRREKALIHAVELYYALELG